MNRIRAVRKKLSQDLGFLVPAVHIRDNLDMPPNAYRISLLGVPLGEAEVYPDRSLAINPGRVQGTLVGVPTRDPARSEEHTSELQSLMRISYAVFCLKKKMNLLPQ